METILCAITWSSSGWTGPVERQDGEWMLGDWVKKHRWGAEDWVFAKDPEQLLKGRLYSYAHGNPSPARVEASGGRFNILFYSKRPDGHVGFVGAYRNALYVSKEDRAKSWKRLDSAKVATRRAEQLRTAFTDPKRGKKESDLFLREGDVRWIVEQDDVLVFEDMPGYVTTDWRAKNAYLASELAMALQGQLARLLDSGDVGSTEAEAAGFSLPDGPVDYATEGRLKQRYHLVRERNTKAAEDFRDSQLRSTPTPHFMCSACDATFVAALGIHAARVFDVHHQVPLAKSPKTGVVPDATKFCMLCATCHRLAHASELFTVDQLRAYLANPT